MYDYLHMTYNLQKKKKKTKRKKKPENSFQIINKLNNAQN